MGSLITSRALVRTAAIGAGAVATLAGAGIAAQTTAARRDRLRYPPPAQHYDIGGRRLHARVQGADRPGPTVVFEAGLGCPLQTWGWIQPEIAEIAPTIAYDRAGLGYSDRGPRRRDAATVTADLRTLLAAAELPPPYLLVGHSIGGLLVRHFASVHSDLIAGMVLADASHPDQLHRSSRQWLGLPLVRAQMQGALINSVVGTIRRSGRYLAAPGIDGLPEPDRDTARSRMFVPPVNLAAYAEFNGWLRYLNDQVRPCQLPGDLPLAVVTAGAVADDDPAHHELQVELAQMSLKGTHQSVEGADHLGLVMHQQHAHAVTDAVRQTVTAAREH